MSSQITHGRRRYTARDAVTAVLVTAGLLIVLAGDSPRRAAKEMQPGITRVVIEAVGGPTGWIADHLPFADIADQMTGWLRSDEDLGTTGGRFSAPAVAAGAASRVAPQAFAPQQLGVPASARRLRSLLVTGDSMSQPLDAELARRLAKQDVRTTRDPHIGTGLTTTDLVDWGKLSTQQTQKLKPDAVVVFIGANDAFPMQTVGGQADCCQARWAAEYATRARAMMQTYSRGGATQVLWITLPAPRDPRRQKISNAVNAAIRVAAGPYGSAVRIVEAARIFTPGGRYRDAMPVDGREQIVRRSDGIHLNQRGSELLADVIQHELHATFTSAASSQR